MVNRVMSIVSGSWFYKNTNGGALLCINFNIHKRRRTYNIYTLLGKITLGNNNCFQRLINCSSPNRLHLCALNLAHYAGDGAGNRGSTRARRDLDNVHCGASNCNFSRQY